MIIHKNSNVITIRLVKEYINDRLKQAEDLWEKTYSDPKQFNEHCISIGRLNELEKFKKWFDEISEVNEEV